MSQKDVATNLNYIKGQPAERHHALTTLRQLIVDNVQEGFEEQSTYGMMGWVIPLEKYPNTYNKQPLLYCALGSQKNYMSLYLMGIYSDANLGAWFKESCEKAGKRLNMGKSCIRFKSLDDLPLKIVGQAIAKFSVKEFISLHEKGRAMSNASKGEKKSTPESYSSSASKPAKSTASAKPTKSAGAAKSKKATKK